MQEEKAVSCRAASSGGVAFRQTAKEHGRPQEKRQGFKRCDFGHKHKDKYPGHNVSDQCSFQELRGPKDWVFFGCKQTTDQRCNGDKAKSAWPSCDLINQGRNKNGACSAEAIMNGFACVAVGLALEMKMIAWNGVCAGFVFLDGKFQVSE